MIPVAMAPAPPPPPPSSGRRLNPDEYARVIALVVVLAVAVLVGAAGIYKVVIEPIVGGGSRFDPGELSAGEWMFVASWLLLLTVNIFLLLRQARK